MFRSTRGNDYVSASKAILNGIAPDGGLYVIDEIPTINLNEVMNYTYQELAAKIISSFFDDFTFNEVLSLVQEAYSSFDIDDVVGLHQTKDAYFLELFHGPTLAFKDLALVVLPRLMALAKEKTNDKRKTFILTATSGDTGGSALNGFKNIPNIDICVFYPNNGVSPVQEAQMNSFKSDKALVVAVEGNFDDCQNLVKKFFLENKDLNLSSANSINIARLVPQIVYYFYSYFHLVKNGAISMNDMINFTVPTGNFGDIFAGFYAKKMGLPIGKLICASNRNNVLTDFFNQGYYDKNRTFYSTNSPSMDILISSNLERLLFYGNDCDPIKTSLLMQELKEKGLYSFANPFQEFYASYASEAETLSTIKECFIESDYLIDPHTAVALKVYKDYVARTNDKSINVIISTASPYKFPLACLEAFGLKASDEASSLLKSLSDYTHTIVPKALNYPEYTKEVWLKNEASSKLRRYLYAKN